MLAANPIHRGCPYATAFSRGSYCIGQPRLSIVDRNRPRRIHHCGVNRENIAQPIQLAETLQMAVGRRVGLDSNHPPCWANLVREWQYVFAAPRTDIDHYVPNLRLVLAKPELCRISEERGNL